MAHIVIINPRFEVSYWGMEHVMPFVGKRANLPVAALPLLAALTPSEHTLTLLDENVEALDFDLIATADIVAVTGMSVQRFRMKEILKALKSRGVFTVVGGAWVTVQEDYFGDLADVIFVGEAEESWPGFLKDWEEKRHQRRYEQAAKSDMSKVPTPRFNLLKMRHYFFGSIQISRGCPFTCEFCDIIVTFGRRPRMKSSAQVIAELEALRRQGMKAVFIVDDNFIGNKNAIKIVLKDLIVYQETQGYPFRLFTEATLDLAEDEELMQLMVDANITSVFIGIETPNEESLKETKKFQNVRPKAGTMLDRIHRIQNAGMEVWCGMIVGFDHDDRTIFEAQREFIQQARIVHVMIGMLYAIPKTPLHARLQKEGRLDMADVSEFGTNIIPVNLSREELRDGYVNVMRDLHVAEAYFDRLDALYLAQNLGEKQGKLKYLRLHPWKRLKFQAINLLVSGVFFWRLMRHIPDAGLRKEYRKRIWGLLKVRRTPSLLFQYIGKCAMHYHNHMLARQLASGQLVNTL